MWEERTTRKRFIARALAATGGALGAAAAGSAAPLDNALAKATAGDTRDPLAGHRLHRDLRALCDFGSRRTGTTAEHKAAAWLARRLRQAGCDVTVEPYEFRQWRLRSFDVHATTAKNRRRRRIAAHPIWATAPGAGEAELVYAGAGTPAELDALDLKGKVVLVDGKLLLSVFATYAIADSYWEAAARGAVAFLGTSDAPDNLVRLLAFGRNELDGNPIPAFTVGRDDFRRLRTAALKDSNPRVRYRLDARFGTGTTHDVIATLPGSGDGALMACAHFDSMFTGAMDDATGVAALIGLAAHFARKPKSERPQTMRFLGVTGHDTGFPHLGVRHWADTHPEQLTELTTFCTLDHIAAVASEDLPGWAIHRPLDEERAAFISDHPHLYAIVMEALATQRLLPAIPLREHSIVPNPDIEGLMVERGVPAVNVTMAYPWYHTREDTPDRIPPRALQRGTAAYAQILERLQALPSPLPPLPALPG